METIVTSGCRNGSAHHQLSKDRVRYGNPLILTRAQPTVTMGGIEARVEFSGMAPGFVGLWQINAEVPASVPPGPAVSLTITAGGVTSNTVTIAVE